MEKKKKDTASNLNPNIIVVYFVSISVLFLVESDACFLHSL